MYRDTSTYPFVNIENLEGSVTTKFSNLIKPSAPATGTFTIANVATSKKTKDLNITINEVDLKTRLVTEYLYF